MEKDLNFKSGNPGAVQYGNFINYYQFHPPEKRITLLPKDVWDTMDCGPDLVALDIGCNAGDLTLALYNHMRESTRRNLSILGVDIDPTLIQRAVEKNTISNISFHHLDFINITNRETVLNGYLQQFEKQKFDVVFCFSTTMWIHLNNGDEGLTNFLEAVCKISNLLIIEPQPWKCYRSALKRVNDSAQVFPLYKNLTFRNNVEDKIEEIILCTGKTKVRETERTQWGRKLVFFK